MTPLPHQLAGANFLSARPRALLADAPRVGKTGAAITACDDIFARRVLVITTASGRAVWEKAWRDWSMFDLPVSVIGNRKAVIADRTIVGWAGLPQIAAELATHAWDVIIPDEAHYAKAWSSQRTQALYGTPGEPGCLATLATHTWPLTGTPIPNAPNDLHPMLYRLAPERLAADPARGWPDVTTYADFLERYCVTRPKRISRWTTISVVVGGRNLEELHARVEGFLLRRTQADVGITEPIYETLPVRVADKDRRALEADMPEMQELLDSIDTGERIEDWHLGVLRRRTGALKAAGVAQAVRDEMAGGLDKVVLMAWHTEVLDALERELGSFGIVRVDGATPPARRTDAVNAFRSKAKPRVFLGQIIACGEAIDLSAAADLIFVESSFVPKDMAQAAQRIVNLEQKRQPRVRVAALAGSIDEALATVLTRKVRDIIKVLK